MNRNITNLQQVAQKQQRLIIGLMSGTSLDGLDIALCSIEGGGLQTKLELLQFETHVYDDDFKDKVRGVFSKPQVDLQLLCLLNPWIALQHAAYINACLKKWNVNKEDIDLIASHGQTIYHAPKKLHGLTAFGNATLQVGDGDHLAVATGIICISDFRQKNIAAGGEGAPLALYGDRILFSSATQDRLLLNIGGIANFTYLPAGGKMENIVCTDTGPGNTMMDALMQKHFPGQSFDKDAMIAHKGKVNQDLLSALQNHSFFRQPFPKTTGPELFNNAYLEAALTQVESSISTADQMATLNYFSANSIATAIEACIENKELQIFGSGGGIHNPLLLQHLKERLPKADFFTTNDLGIDPDAKEAILFALLANEAVAGDENGMLSMGKISFPY